MFAAVARRATAAAAAARRQASAAAATRRQASAAAGGDFGPDPWYMKRPYPNYPETVKPDPNADPDIRQLSEATGVPCDQLADPHLHFWTMRTEQLLDDLGVAAGERDAWLERNTLSPGQFTLEFALPSPPPVHCFLEPPVVKEADDE